MRNLILILTLTLAVFAVPAFAEGPAKDAPVNTEYLRQHAATRGFLLGRPVKPKFTPDNKFVLFLRSEARVPRMRLYEFDVATGKTRELLTPEQVLKGAEENLSPEEKARRERQRVTVGGFSDYQLSKDGSFILLPLSGKLYVQDRAKGTVRELATGAGPLLDPKLSPDGKFVAYVRNNDVHVYDLAANTWKQVTIGGTEKKPHGLAEFVAQEEMGRSSGYWWSPDGQYLAFQETDNEGVEIWYVADPSHPERAPAAQYYPRPGKANAKVRLGIVPAAGGEIKWVKWDEKEYEYLASVKWAQDGPLAITLQDRKQQQLTVWTVETPSGKLDKKLYTNEQRRTWQEIDQHVPIFLPDGSCYSATEKIGLIPCKEMNIPHLDGMLLANPLRYRGLLSVDSKTKQAYFLGNYLKQPGEIHIFRMTLPPDDGTLRGQGKGDPDEPKRITKEPGQYGATFSRDHSLYVLTATTPGSLPRSTVHKIDGTVIGELPSVAEEPPFKPGVEFVDHAAIVRPRNFDLKKKYPVIVDVYGGPKHQHVVAAMRNWLLPQWLADQGFIVVAIENRGTPGVRDEWEEAIYQKFGSVPLDDQVAGLKAIGAKYPELDLDRVGIVGWSFGGYMSALAVLKRPDVFKAAVAGAPVTDWEDYDTHYTERYLGLLPESKKAYEDASLLPLAPKLERPLLLVHGTADDNVYFRHTLRLTDALFRAGKDFEVLPLPSLTHMVPDPIVTERLWTRQVAFFHKHLGKPIGRGE